jgi:hypothetical protein
MCFTNTSLLSKRLAHCEIGSAAILFAPAYGMAVICFIKRCHEILPKKMILRVVTLAGVYMMSR